MSKSFIVQKGAGTTQDAGLTRHSPLGGPLVRDTLGEVYHQTPIRDAGVFNNLFMYVSANTLSASGMTYTLRNNGANTALAISYNAAQTGIKEDTSNAVSFANTDLANYEIITPAGTGNIACQIAGCEFSPNTATQCISFLVCGDQSTLDISGDSSSAYFFPNSLPQSSSSTEDFNQLRLRTPGTTSDLWVNIFSNTRITDTVFRTRRSQANGNQSVTYTAGQTGSKEDTTNSDSLSAGDDYSYQCTTGTGGGNIAVIRISTTLITANNVFVLASSDNDNVFVSFNTTTYFGVGGRGVADTTEANSQIYPRFSFTAKELGCYVSLNTIATSPTTVTLCDDGADSALTLSYNAGQSGLKNNIDDIVEILSGSDETNIKVVTPNTSGNLQFRWMSILGDTSEPVNSVMVPSAFIQRRVCMIGY